MRSRKDNAMHIFVMFLLTLSALLIFIGLVSRTDDCKGFKDTPLSDVPARCITPVGGVY